MNQSQFSQSFDYDINKNNDNYNLSSSLEHQQYQYPSSSMEMNIPSSQYQDIIFQCQLFDSENQSQKLSLEFEDQYNKNQPNDNQNYTQTISSEEQNNENTNVQDLQEQLKAIPQKHKLIKRMSNKSSSSYISLNKQKNKGRMVQEVLDLVSKYRKLFDEGIFNKATNSQKRLTLQQCAELVGISKKTLDDYYLQINKARDLNFQFSGNENKPFGVVRQFIKKNKQ